MCRAMVLCLWAFGDIQGIFGRNTMLPRASTYVYRGEDGHGINAVLLSRIYIQAHSLLSSLRSHFFILCNHEASNIRLVFDLGFLVFCQIMEPDRYL